jgi:pilus assembly protein CpaE
MIAEAPVAHREKLRVLVTGSFEGRSELLGELRRRVDVELVGSTEEVRDAASSLSGDDVHVVLHGTNGWSPAGNGDGFALPVVRAEISAIREHTYAPIILLTSGASSEFLDEALEADVADVLVLPQMTDTVVFAVRKARFSGRRGTVADKQEAPRGQLITVFSPKGGTGKTVTSTNLSAALAKHHGKRVLLVDLDLQFGDAAIMLGVTPDKTIYDLVTAPGALDSEKLAGYTTKHSSGVDILAAPLRPEDAELVTEPKVMRILEVARESYDVVVVDTAPFFYGPMLATLEPTDHLLLLCGLDVPTLKNVRVSLHTLKLLDFPIDRVRIVLNRVTPKVGIKPADVADALGIPVSFEFPNDDSVPIAVNQGDPAILVDSKSDYAKAVREMARALVPIEKTPAVRERRLGGRKA